MTYLKTQNAFNMTSTKLRKWHSSHHRNAVENCLFCRGDMQEISEFLSLHDLDVLDVGHAWIKIKAEKNYRPDHGGVTDESRVLYYLVSGIHEKEMKRQEKELDVFSCPECNSLLSLKEGSYGKFWGCSNYPKCKYTKKFVR